MEKSEVIQKTLLYKYNILERVIVESIIPRNMIINRGAAEVDNHISRDDIFDYHTLKNVIFILLYRTLKYRTLFFYNTEHYSFIIPNIIPLFSIFFPLIMRREVPMTAQCLFATNG